MLEKETGKTPDKQSEAPTPDDRTAQDQDDKTVEVQIDFSGHGLEMEDPEGLVGKTIADRYEIISLLGHGGMGAVYKARHVLIDKIVAFKVMLARHLFDETTRKRFSREASSLAKLSHSNLVSVQDAGLTEKGQPFFVMEFVEGESLDQLFERDTLTPDQFVEIFSQAAEALAYAHGRGLIHRDIKPGNIMLVEDERGGTLIKIVDFGIAKALPSDEDTEQKLTKTGFICGSPVYMSPEHCEGRRLDPRSDIYSLGCVMYESLAGVPPFSAETPQLTLMKHVSEKPLRIKKVNANAKVPQAIEEIIFKCLEKKVDARFDSASDLIEALRNARSTGTPSKSASRAPRKGKSKAEPSGTANGATPPQATPPAKPAHAAASPKPAARAGLKNKQKKDNVDLKVKPERTAADHSAGDSLELSDSTLVDPSFGSAEGASPNVGSSKSQGQPVAPSSSPQFSAPRQKEPLKLEVVDIAKSLIALFIAISCFPLLSERHLMIRIYARDQDPGSWQEFVCRFIFEPWNSIAHDAGGQWMLYAIILAATFFVLDKVLPADRNIWKA